MKKLGKIICIALICLIILVAIIKIFNIDKEILKNIYPKKYEEYVEKYSKEYNVDPLVVFSVIKAESNFKKDAKSSSGAKGLMQLMDATAEEMANKIDTSVAEEESLFDPEKNIMIGVRYYSELLDMYEGNMLLALTAYNAGIGTVDNWIEKGIINSDGSNVENIPYKETNNYVRKILRDYKIYTNLE